MTIIGGSADYLSPRPGVSHIGPSFRVDRIRGNGFRVISTPHPLHWAAVTLSTIPNRAWVVTVETAQVKPRIFSTGEGQLVAALSHAGRLVGALYRVDMRSRFTGPQRYAMGRNQCPARIACTRWACPKKLDSGHYHLCTGVPDSPLTVYCAGHTDRPEMPGDAFRRLDDSAGGG